MTKHKYFDGSDGANLWKALHDPEFRALLTAKGRATFPLPLVDDKAPTDFRERLLRERQSLYDKVSALDKFITTSPVFHTLPFEQQILMNRQFGFMQEYYGVLDERLALLGSEPVSPSDDAGEITEMKETRVISDDEPLPFD